MGKCIIWDSDQETPNIQHLEFEYGDGSIIQFDVWGMAPNPEGHLSSSLCHLGNIACRLTLHFNPYAETFINDADADTCLTKAYRFPYELTEKV